MLLKPFHQAGNEELKQGLLLDFSSESQSISFFFFSLKNPVRTERLCVGFISFCFFTLRLRHKASKVVIINWSTSEITCRATVFTCREIE